MEMIGQVAHCEKMNPNDVKLKDVQKRWRDWNSHFVFEGHLPGIVPLSYVDTIVLPHDASVLDQGKIKGQPEYILSEQDKKDITKLTDIGIRVEWDDFKGYVGGKMEHIAYERALKYTEAPREQARIGVCVSLPGASAGHTYFLPIQFKGASRYLVFNASPKSTF